MKRILTAILALLCLVAILPSCARGSEDLGFAVPNDGYYQAAVPNAGYDASPVEQNPDASAGDEGQANTVIENSFVDTTAQAVSTFSADVDTASYAYFRKLVNSDYPAEQIQNFASYFRTEEFLNYFRYQAQGPCEGELFGVTAAIIPTPWNETTSLLRLTLQAEDAVPAVGNNLVFLIDVSGSMQSEDKLPLIKKAFSMLVSQLTEQDRVSIVTYAGKEEVLLTGCPGNQGETILQAVNKLNASGSTNGQAGLEKAYQLAADYFMEEGNNRIIMASDGDLNVGISSAEELKQFVEAKRDQGIYLSVLGVGTGNYKDSSMEALADNGNGVYYYIDGESEAEKVFGTDLLSTLYTVAGDVKLQLTFDPLYVQKYRLIGYENRLLANEDFDNDFKDAGEVGAGHQVTVFYELVLTDAALTGEQADWMKLAVRYKRSGEVASTLNEYPVGAQNRQTADDDMTFMTCLIGATLVLHDSQYRNGLTMADVVNTLDGLNLDLYPDRAEFRELVRKLR